MPGGGCIFVKKLSEYDFTHVIAASAVQSSANATRQKVLFLGELENEIVQ